MSTDYWTWDPAPAQLAQVQAELREGDVVTIEGFMSKGKLIEYQAHWDEQGLHFVPIAPKE